MTGTMTWVGLDVHARSTHAAAIDSLTGELKRMRFGPGVEAPVAWLAELRGSGSGRVMRRPDGVRALSCCGRDGDPDGRGRAGQDPAGAGDRVKTDRKDAELLARLLLAGQLTPVTVPPAGVEAARELTRLHDACRRDLMTARHRLSKMLLRHGRVYPKPTTWKRDHRHWLADQHFDEPASELVYLDLLARVDALTARKLQLARTRSPSSRPTSRWWPTVARLRASAAIDTLTALSIHLELGADWHRFEKAPRVGCLAGADPVAEPVRRVNDARDRSPRPARRSRGGC